MSKDTEQYRDRMEFPMEALAIELFGFADLSCGTMSDPEIVEHATRKSKMLKEMILATGFSEEMLKACMIN